jgi:hypothetical protein
MWVPRRLTTLWASMACYRDSSTSFTIRKNNISGAHVVVPYLQEREVDNCRMTNLMCTDSCLCHVSGRPVVPSVAQAEHKCSTSEVEVFHYWNLVMEVFFWFLYILHVCICLFCCWFIFVLTVTGHWLLSSAVNKYIKINQINYYYYLLRLPGHKALWYCHV